MDEIEEELYKIHAEARRTRGEDENVVNDERVPPSGSERLAFGTVTKLDEGSPANTAVGIQARKKKKSLVRSYLRMPHAAGEVNYWMISIVN